MTTVTLHNVDPRTLHHQILQLELLHRSMSPGSLDAQTIQATLLLMHEIEETLRNQARAEHHHPLHPLHH